MEDVVDKSYDTLESIRVDLDLYSGKYKFTEGNFDLNVTINDIARIGNLPDNTIPNSAVIYSICDKEMRFMEVMYTYFEVLKNTSEDMQLVDEMSKKLSHVTGSVRKFSSSLWHLRQLTDPDFAGARTVDEHLWTNKMLEDYKMTDLGKLRIFILRGTFKRNLKRCGVDVGDQDIVDEPKVLGSFSISSGSTGSTVVSGNLGIEFRGFSSQEFPKKSYGFETRDVEDVDVDLDIELLGPPEEHDWILSASYSDKTLMRNVLNYDISRDMGHYASRTKFVDLYINNKYKGIYALMEKLKRDPERINITKNKDGVTRYSIFILSTPRPRTCRTCRGSPFSQSQRAA